LGNTAGFRALLVFLITAAYLCFGSISAFACMVGDEAIKAAGIRLDWKTGAHPLLARVYDVKSPWIKEDPSFVSGNTCAPYHNEFVKFSYVISGTLQDGGIVVLGEVHDNGEHHRFEASALPNAKSNFSQKLGVVIEQLRADQQDGVRAFHELDAKTLPSASLSDFKRLTDWDKSGWQQYNYDPLLQAAIDAKLPIYAGDVTRDAIMKVAKEGEAALPAEDRTRLKLDVPLGPKLDDASLSEIEEAHCGTMPKEAFTGMAYAQRYRDATLADNVLKAADKHGSAILIAGNGHVRTDRGVPWYIKQRAPNAKVVSIMLIEVEDGKNDPETYVPRDPDGKPAVDYILFTPGVTGRPDPCEKMRAKMGK
jgi:uncharacterized iron-regulated protein